MTPENYGTYQNFVKSSGCSSFYSPGSQNKLRPQLPDIFIAASNLQCIHQASHLCQLATACQHHQPQRRSDLPQLEACSHEPPEDRSSSFPSIASTPPRSMGFRRNLARATTQVFLAECVDLGQSDDSLDSAA